MQGWQSRLDVEMRCVNGKDQAFFTLRSGPSNYDGGTLRIDFADVDAVVNALGCHDPRIEAIRKRIYAEIDKLNAEAPKAVARAERRALAQRRQEERERKAAHKERLTILRELSGDEKMRLERLGVTSWDKDGNPTSTDWIEPDKANLRYGMKPNQGFVPTVLVDVPLPGFKRKWQTFAFNLTYSRWEFKFTPSDIGIDETLIDDTGFGWITINEGTYA